MRFVAAILFLFSLSAAENTMIGQPAREWTVSDWMNSKALKLEDLRGKVVLVRWWTAPGCKFCASTAPSLNKFYADYHAKGLEVLGFYHHKNSAPLNVEDVKKAAEKFKFQFPVAIDRDWTTVKDWWLNSDKRRWTSVSFLIDRKGVVRHIHPGGQYVEGDDAYAEMKRKIEEVVGEK